MGGHCWKVALIVQKQELKKKCQEKDYSQSTVGTM